MALITPAAYAKSKGLSRQAIGQAIDAGRIPVKVDARGRKMVDPVKADAALAALTDHVQSENGLGNAGKGSADSGRSAWIDTKTSTERIKLALLELELEEQRGELLRKAAIEASIGPIYANVRDQLLSVGARIAPKVFNCKTIPEVAQAIETAIREAMRNLAVKPKGKPS